jgi:hypothetical protein
MIEKLCKVKGEVWLGSVQIHVLLISISGGTAVKSRLTPNETPTEVPPALKAALKKAKEMSPKAVKGSLPLFT